MMSGLCVGAHGPCTYIRTHLLHCVSGPWRGMDIWLALSMCQWAGAYFWDEHCAVCVCAVSRTRAKCTSPVVTCSKTCWCLYKHHPCLPRPNFTSFTMNINSVPSAEPLICALKKKSFVMVLQLPHKISEAGLYACTSLSLWMIRPSGQFVLSVAIPIYILPYLTERWGI